MEALAILARDLGEDGVEPLPRGLERVRCHGEQAVVAQAREEAVLDLVDERALGEGIHVLDRGGLLARRELVHRGEEEAVRTRGEVLERRRRERPLVGRVLVDRRERLGRRIDEAVRGAERLRVPAHPAEAERAGEMRVGVDEVAAFAVDLVLRLLEDVLEEREIVLRLVDRVFALRRCRPADARLGRARRLLGEVLEVSELTLGDAEHLEAVERRRARTGLLDVEARVGEDDASLRGADREPERETLVVGAVFVRRQIG